MATTEEGNGPISERGTYDALCAYTLSLRDGAFIHQHVVDAFAAQHADERTKPIGLVFALVGLYLLVEKDFTGRQVQRVHMDLARHKRSWPPVSLPRDRGSWTAVEVMARPEGPERDAAIHSWCESVWAAFADNRQMIADLLRAERLPAIKTPTGSDREGGEGKR